MRIGKPPSFFGELINIRCPHLRRPVAPKIAIAEIVREDQNHVWRRVTRTAVRSAREEKCQTYSMYQVHIRHERYWFLSAVSPSVVNRSCAIARHYVVA